MGIHHQQTFRPAAGYGLSILLVPVYVNMFGIWKLLSTLLGEGIMLILPFAVTASMLAGALLVLYKRFRKRSASPTLLPAVIGICLCLAALAVPDPRFPVKRIHVAEYILLSLVVRYAMSVKLQGLPLLFFSALFASLLGIHDEFLQGLHQARTYGLRDMTVNGLSSWGGALLFHSMNLFEHPQQSGGSHLETQQQNARPYLFWLVISVAALIVPLAWYRGHELPLWPAMPLLGTVFLFALYESSFEYRLRHGITAISLVSFALIPYPALTHVTTISFY